MKLVDKKIIKTKLSNTGFGILRRIKGPKFSEEDIEDNDKDGKLVEPDEGKGPDKD